MFDGVLAELAAEHSPLALDLPGHGRSGGLDSLGSIERMAASSPPSSRAGGSRARCSSATRWAAPSRSAWPSTARPPCARSSSSRAARASAGGAAADRARRRGQGAAPLLPRRLRTERGPGGAPARLPRGPEDRPARARRRSRGLPRPSTGRRSSTAWRSRRSSRSATTRTPSSAPAASSSRSGSAARRSCGSPRRATWSRSSSPAPSRPPSAIPAGAAVSLSGRVAIAGVYEHPTRFAPDKTEFQIMAESRARRARRTPASRSRDVDGLCDSGHLDGRHRRRRARRASEPAAALARRHEHRRLVVRGARRARGGGDRRPGTCEVALVALRQHGGVEALRDRHGRRRRARPGAAFEAPVRPDDRRQPTRSSRSRHMHEYGTTSEQLAEIAVTMRRHAGLNPRRQVSRADHRRGRARVAA